MTRALARTNFHSSTLIRCLSELAIVDAADPGNAFAEQLGQWIHFADAIALSAVHSGGAASPAATRSAAKTVLATEAEFERIRASLADSISASCSPAPASKRTHISLPVPEFALPMNLATAYAPYRRFYEAHQRDMELGIQPLRVNLRAALAKASPRLGKLAELDAVLEKILRERESKLLSKLPALLKKHFEQLFKEHQQKLADADADMQQADIPAAWTQAGAWLARFCSDMQMLLLAELELRLQPATGLIEAFKQDTQ